MYNTTVARINSAKAVNAFPALIAVPPRFNAVTINLRMPNLLFPMCCHELLRSGERAREGKCMVHMRVVGNAENAEPSQISIEIYDPSHVVSRMRAEESQRLAPGLASARFHVPRTGRQQLRCTCWLLPDAGQDRGWVLGPIFLDSGRAGCREVAALSVHVVVWRTSC
jgi:hypothetical protein